MYVGVARSQGGYFFYKKKSNSIVIEHNIQILRQINAFTLHPLVDMFISTPTRLTWEVSATLQLLSKDYVLIYTAE